MLIAIMGDSFERVIENRDVNATRIKLNFMNDMAGTVGKKSSAEETDVFLYVIKPEENEHAEDEWVGGIKKITTTINEEVGKVKDELEKKNKLLSDKLEEMMHKDQVANRNMENYVDQVVKRNVTERIDNIERNMFLMSDKLDQVLQAMFPE